MSFGTHDFTVIADQRQQSLNRKATEFRLVRRRTSLREPSWARRSHTRDPDAA
jgi:hypothetical protein